METPLAMGEGETVREEGNLGITVFWYTKNLSRGEIAYGYVFPSFEKLSDIAYYLLSSTRTSFTVKYAQHCNLALPL